MTLGEYLDEKARLEHEIEKFEHDLSQAKDTDPLRDQLRASRLQRLKRQLADLEKAWEAQDKT